MSFTLHNRHDVHYLFDGCYSLQEYTHFPIEVKLMMKTVRITLRPWLDTDAKALSNNPASGRVMEKCGFIPTGETAFDSKLYHGADKPIRVMRLVL